jgi:hypothetical protein
VAKHFSIELEHDKETGFLSLRHSCSATFLYLSSKDPSSCRRMHFYKQTKIRSKTKPQTNKQPKSEAKQNKQTYKSHHIKRSFLQCGEKSVFVLKDTRATCFASIKKKPSFLLFFLFYPNQMFEDADEMQKRVSTLLQLHKRTRIR